MVTVLVIKTFPGNADEVRKYGNPHTGCIDDREPDPLWRRRTDPKESWKHQKPHYIQLTPERAAHLEKLGVVQIVATDPLSAYAERPKKTGSKKS